MPSLRANLGSQVQPRPFTPQDELPGDAFNEGTGIKRKKPRPAESNLPEGEDEYQVRRAVPGGKSRG